MKNNKLTKEEKIKKENELAEAKRYLNLCKGFNTPNIEKWANEVARLSIELGVEQETWDEYKRK